MKAGLSRPQKIGILTAVALFLAAVVVIILQPQGITVKCKSGPAYDSRMTVRTNPFFILGELILTGQPDEVKALVGRLGKEKGINLELIEECVISNLDRLPKGDPERERDTFIRDSIESEHIALPFYDSQQRAILSEIDSLTTSLYQITGDVSEADVINAVAELRNDNGELEVYADPNYLVGHLANNPCGDPFGVEGSPFGVEGSPFGVEGSPFGVEGSTGSSRSDGADPRSFWEQWAFKEIGLRPPDERVRSKMGNKVLVGIFDTSPFSFSGTKTVKTISDPQITPKLKLNVHHPFDPPEISASTTFTNPVKDHGLFVAGLVYAVAPKSEIHLYRVLNDNGCGELFDLIRAIEQFLEETHCFCQKYAKAVINLSLGIRKPRELPVDENERAEAIKEIEEMGGDVERVYELAKTEKAIESLEKTMLTADQLGVIIVAAAGNDSVRSKDPNVLQITLDMQLPAAYDHVIGVAASGPGAVPACYSNIGDVVAPGGQAEYTENDVDPGHPYCTPQTNLCLASPGTGQGSGDPASCAYGLISLTTMDGSNNLYGYSYWVGTSFATPLVSGLAALHYQNVGYGAVFGRIQADLQPVPEPQLFGEGLIHIPDPDN